MQLQAVSVHNLFRSLRGSVVPGLRVRGIKGGSQRVYSTFAGTLARVRKTTKLQPCILNSAPHQQLQTLYPPDLITGSCRTLQQELSTSSSTMAGPGEAAENAEEKLKERLGQEEAREFDNSLFFEYEFSIDQLMEIAGLCVAQAMVRCYPSQEVGVARPQVLILCGPGNNGGDGLAAARHLLFFGYNPVIFYPKRTAKEIYQILVNQCEKMNIPFLDQLPSAAEINAQFHIVVDALFGFSFKGAVRPPFDTVLGTLKQVRKPIASVDIPSGWDVEKGDTAGDGLRPDLLISLTAPKECTKFFQGRFHYLGLRIIPAELAAKYKVKLPTYPGTDQIVRLS